MCNKKFPQCCSHRLKDSRLTLYYTPSKHLTGLDLLHSPVIKHSEEHDNNNNHQFERIEELTLQSSN